MPIQVTFLSLMFKMLHWMFSDFTRTFIVHIVAHYNEPMNWFKVSHMIATTKIVLFWLLLYKHKKSTKTGGK